MHKRSSGWNGVMALKLDISKAYDRLEWNFLESIMKCMGFSEEWIRLVMICVSMVTYSFKVNGEPVGFVSPKRGIRQGDPLSPCLFVLCAEGLSAVLRNAEERGLNKGVEICKNAPSISHLLFADDSFLFARGTLDECQNIKSVLTKYELASGQAINFIKSCVAFSPNLTECDQQLLADC
ncbi:hypothetical protein ACFX12_026443 [Malus domestica]